MTNRRYVYLTIDITRAIYDGDRDIYAALAELRKEVNELLLALPGITTVDYVNDGAYEDDTP